MNWDRCDDKSDCVHFEYTEEQHLQQVTVVSVDTAPGPAGTGRSKPEESALLHTRLSCSLLLGALREVVISFPVVLSLYFVIQQEGPWLWLVECQLQLFKGYSPGLTLAVCLVFAIVFTTVLHGLLREAGWPARPVFGHVPLLVMDWWTSLPKWLAVLLLFAVLAVVLGLWFYLPAELAGPRTEVSARELEKGKQPGSRWLVIKGQPLVERALVFGTEQAVCMISERWHLGEPVAVVLCASPWAPLPREPTTVEGIAMPMGVPGLIRSSFAQKGTPIAEGALYVAVGKTPATERIWGVVAAIGAGVVLVIVVLGRIRSAPQGRPNEAAPGSLAR